jgi:membrane protease subunit HflC
MNRVLGPILIAGGLAAIAAANTFYIVPETQQALVLQFGAVDRVINTVDGKNGPPGLYVKVPFVQNVQMYDRRNLGFNLQEQAIVAADQQRLIVDAYARWQITDPLRFRQAAQDEETGRSRLENIMTGALRRVLGSAPQNEIISTRRGELMKAIAVAMNQEAAALGVTVIDVRIRQADLPTETAERVFERMRTERQQAAAKLRAEGDEQATKIRAEADRTVTVTLATAREQAEKTRGEGDASRTRIFAQSFGRDPEFAAFYRSMQAYERAMPKGTQMVVPPDGEFFRYLRDKDGAPRR